ncbi:MAG: VanZ family protein [Candidatus Komeilibacteria bacterium]
MKIAWHNFKYGIFAAAWMSLIWLLSNRSVLNVGLSGLWDILFKKSAHIFVYAVLGLLLVKLLLGYKKWSKEDNQFVFAGLLLLAFFLGILYAISDEIHQSFIPGRNASVVDIGIDTVGLFFGVVWGLKLSTDKLRTSIKILLTR